MVAVADRRLHPRPAFTLSSSHRIRLNLIIFPSPPLPRRFPLSQPTNPSLGSDNCARAKHSPPNYSSHHSLSLAAPRTNSGETSVPQRTLRPLVRGLSNGHSHVSNFVACDVSVRDRHGFEQRPEPIAAPLPHDVATKCTTSAHVVCLQEQTLSILGWICAIKVASAIARLSVVSLQSSVCARQGLCLPPNAPVALWTPARGVATGFWARHPRKRASQTV
jgi:hypothetical protein